ncbi:MAG: phage shock protein operon transcriptional activator [Hyphomicrobiales bacterium]|nr:phage shock protein operon transcriptional activator [Hyphomicrobiales bacterium]
MSAVDLPPLIGQSSSFLQVMQDVSRVAPLDRPVIITGERGTGKELIAARLHFLSERWSKQFIKLNCGALSESLLESELFGHEAGAFTGAVRRRAGRFERADGGSLFLDEIGNAPLSVQERILRVVEYGEFERLGSSAMLRCDVRMIAATNADLRREADHRRFRHDLLDRLAFEVLTVPPLRARLEDITILADHFGRGIAVELGWSRYPGFSARAITQMHEYPWPGNVRELKNVVERAVYRWQDHRRPIDTVQFDPFASLYAVEDGDVSAHPSPGHQEHRSGDDIDAAPFTPTDFSKEVARYERDLLTKALVTARYNQRAAAQSLNLAYHQFRARARKHGLGREP